MAWIQGAEGPDVKRAEAAAIAATMQAGKSLGRHPLHAVHQQRCLVEFDRGSFFQSQHAKSVSLTCAEERRLAAGDSII
eukprot:6544639-Pyramimonas_sp.AAC.1